MLVCLCVLVCVIVPRVRAPGIVIGVLAERAGRGMLLLAGRRGFESPGLVEARPHR